MTADTNRPREPRTRWVEKFGKHGKFDAYDGVSPHGTMLEPFVERAAYDAVVKHSAEYMLLAANRSVRIAELEQLVATTEAERDELLACEKIHVSDIADLEKQLSESTRQVAEYKGHYTSEQQLSARLGEKVDTLQSRLAECEEINSDLNDANGEWQKLNKDLREKLAAAEAEKNRLEDLLGSVYELTLEQDTKSRIAANMDATPNGWRFRK